VDPEIRWSRKKTVPGDQVVHLDLWVQRVPSDQAIPEIQAVLWRPWLQCLQEVPAALNSTE